MENNGLTPNMGTFLDKFVAANPSLGQEVKDDVDEIVGEIYVIFAEDEWGKKNRRTGRVNALQITETEDGTCSLGLTVTSEHLLQFELSHLAWTEKAGWTARCPKLTGPIELKTLIVEFK